MIQTMLTQMSMAQTIAKDPTRPPKYKTPAELASQTDEQQTDANDTLVEEQVVDGITFPRVKLSAIFYSEVMRYAILNNEIVNEGESWNNAVLAQVLPDRIILERENKQREITLSENKKIIIEKNYDN